MQAVNDLPTFAGVPAVLSFPEDSSAGPIAFTVADVDHPVASLLVSVASNNATLLRAVAGPGGIERQLHADVDARREPVGNGDGDDHGV